MTLALVAGTVHIQLKKTLFVPAKELGRLYIVLSLT